MAKKKEKGLYTWGCPEYTNDTPTSLKDAVGYAVGWLNDNPDDEFQVVYQLVPVKRVRRADTVVEDV